MSGSRLDLELDHEVGLGALTVHGGVPALIEHFQSSGGAAAIDGSVPYNRRKRGLSASEMCENRVTLIMNGQRGVSADTALGLARYFGTTPQLWLNQQKAWKFRQAETTTGREIAERVTPRQSRDKGAAADAHS